MQTLSNNGTGTLTPDFPALLTDWREKALSAAEAKWNAKTQYAVAYRASEGKNEAIRTADADLGSWREQLSAEQARIEAKAAEFMVEFALRTAGGG